MQIYMRPPIPSGFVHVSGTWDKAFIIEDVKKKNQFTWIPLGKCIDVDEYLQNLYGLEGYSMKYDFTKDMIKKYQGIYISTYLISKNAKGDFVSIKGKPVDNITYRIAKDKVSIMCKEMGNFPIRTRLMHEAEYDIIVKCIAGLIGTDTVSDKQFEEYGLHGMNDLWIWTLTNYSEFSKILKKGDSMKEKEKVYANNEWFESPYVGVRAVLILF